MVVRFGVMKKNSRKYLPYHKTPKLQVFVSFCLFLLSFSPSPILSLPLGVNRWKMPSAISQPPPSPIKGSLIGWPWIAHNKGACEVVPRFCNWHGACAKATTTIVAIKGGGSDNTKKVQWQLNLKFVITSYVSSLPKPRPNLPTIGLHAQGQASNKRERGDLIWTSFFLFSLFFKKIEAKVWER